MIHTITEPIKTAISALDFYSGDAARLAGVVIPISKTDADGNTIVFPASCDVDGQACYEQGRYFDLLPNDNYQTVGYFEQRSDVRFTGYLDAKDQWMLHETDLRFVSWLNVKKLGYTDCSITSRVVLGVISTLTANKGELSRNNGRFSIADANFTGAAVEVEPVRQAVKDPSIFARYTFARNTTKTRTGGVTQFFEILYPWDYFAIDLRCTLIVGRDCFDAVGLEPEIIC